MENDIKINTVSVLMKIQMLQPTLSRAEQRVAEYILNNSSKVISLSVAGLADLSGVSDATVVRACKSFGFSSYQEFKVTLARNTVSPLQSIHAEIGQNDSPQLVIDKVFQENIHTLQYTHNTISQDALVQAADVLQSARRVVIFGLGNSSAIALDLQHKLMRLGIFAQAFWDTHMQEIAAVQCSEGDVVFAISDSGSSIDVVECAKLGRSNGACVISLTNIGRSPLSKISDIALMTASRETEYRLTSIASRIAQMTVIDCLYTLIALKTPGSTDIFYKIDKALDRKKY